MANPQAVMRAAQAGPMGGGKMDGMEAMEGMASPQAAPSAGEGLDAMVQSLEGVGAFLKAQGPAGQRAMTHFQALLQEMAGMGGQAPQAAPEMAEEPGPGRVHESRFPGAVVL